MLCTVCLGQRDWAAFARNLTRDQMKALGFPRDWHSQIAIDDPAPTASSH
ncbi:MAG: hypothetical protein L0Z50_43355 [Verrucomicrobiales bacterium]|nr:hypothetical protein [Verrucomicrobiales bacterium]